MLSSAQEADKLLDGFLQDKRLAEPDDQHMDSKKKFIVALNAKLACSKAEN